MNGLLTHPIQLLVLLCLFVVSITLHEFGHALAADALGDDTPRLAGRLTLNPLAHLDVLGTVMVVFANFGWAKPVPIRPDAFRNPRLGNVIVSLAGPFMNLLLAMGSLLVFKHVPNLSPGAGEWLYRLFSLNLILLVFNLLPIPPLDGGHVLEALLPRRWLPAYRHLVPYGMVFLMIFFLLPAARGPMDWLYGSVQNLMVNSL